MERIDLGGEEYPGAKIVSTVEMIYLFGGEEPATGNIKTTAIGFT